MKNTVTTSTAGKGTWGSFLNLLKTVKMPYLWILLCIAVTMLNTQLSLMFPSFTQQIMAGDLSTKIIAGSIITVIGSAITTSIYQCLCRFVTAIVSERFRGAMWNKIIALPMRFFDRNSTRELINRVVEDATKLSEFMTYSVANTISSTYAFITTFIILFSYDWHLLLAECILIPLIVIKGVVQGKVNFTWNRKLQAKQAELAGKMSELLSNIPLYKTFVQEKKADAESGGHIKALYSTNLKILWIGLGFSGVSTLINVAQTLILILFGIVLIRQGSITLDVWIAFYLYSAGLTNRVIILMNIWNNIKIAQGAMKRISDISCESEEALDEGERYDGKPAALSFEHVSFGYEDKTILDEVSFTVPQGSKTAIVGLSGAGKTTVLRLLERLYSPDSGVIRCGEKNIADYSLQSWRSAIGYVTQDAWLVNGTIRENLLYGVHHAVTDEELNKALQAACAAQFVTELENGLDTEVGEGGSKLSGGQRQRITIARMILTNPSVILLDEATSNLDAVAEAEVEQAMETLRQGRTMLVIAHRLRTIQDADQILVLDGHTLAETGTHDALMANSGLYRAMVEQQTEGGATA